MFSSFLGCAGGVGTAGKLNTLVNLDPVMFNNADAAADFTNQLQTQQLGVVITQPQAAVNPPVLPGGGDGGSCGGSGSGGPTRGDGTACPTATPTSIGGGGNVGGPAPGGTEYPSIKAAL